MQRSSDRVSEVGIIRIVTKLRKQRPKIWHGKMLRLLAQVDNGPNPLTILNFCPPPLLLPSPDRHHTQRAGAHPTRWRTPNKPLSHTNHARPATSVSHRIRHFRPTLRGFCAVQKTLAANNASHPKRAALQVAPCQSLPVRWMRGRTCSATAK